VKEIVLIGGPNGAGKTTASRILLPEFLQLNEFLNADEIARAIAPHDPDAAAFAAGRELLERMRRLVHDGKSFALETTCSGKSYIPILKKCKDDGWRLTFLYFWLPRPEDSIARVAKRVSEGGHDIPTEAIYRRFKTGLWNALNLYLPLANRAEIYDNSNRQRTLVASQVEGAPVQVLDHELWARMMEASQ
jgi:predicted ABC-type ATPase